MTDYHKEIVDPHPSCPYHVEKDIDLRQVFVALKKDWKRYFSIMLFFALFSTGLAFFLPKKYLVESILLPPEDSSVNSLMLPEYFQRKSDPSVLIQVTRKSLLLLLLNNLQSFEFRRRFLENKKWYRTLDLQGIPDNNKSAEANKQLEANIHVAYKISSRDDIKYIKVDFLGKDKYLSSNLLNSYIKFVDTETVNSVIKSIQTKTRVEIKSVQKAISTSRLIAEKIKEDKIYKIKEDLKIAKKLNIIEPSRFLFRSYNQNIISITDNINIINDPPGYLKGVNMLQAELDAVRNRKNNDPFIPELQKLLEREEYLQRILNMKFENVHAVRIDKLASPEFSNEKPSTPLVIVVGFMFGVLISFFTLLLTVLYKKTAPTN